MRFRKWNKGHRPKAFSVGGFTESDKECNLLTSINGCTSWGVHRRVARLDSFIFNMIRQHVHVAF
jgi:hypothetical protein